MIQHYFGANIRALRKARGWSQKDLALKLGKKVSAISSYETDGKAPTLETALLMAELFGVSVDELIYGQDAEFLSIKHLSQNQKDAIAELLHCYLVNSSKDLRALTLVKIIHSLNL